VILVDTSVWVEFDRATGSALDRRLTELITGGGPVAVTEPVLMEILAGARTERHQRRLERLLTSFRWLRFDPAADFAGAATLYRSCRVVGITPRGLVDCMIATVALRSGAPLLALDQDFEQIATVVPLRLEPT
jgi:predicted nucleic acid-binding protein